MSLPLQGIANLKNHLNHPSPEKRLGPDASWSLVIHFFFQFGASMSGVFLNLYLWRLTESLWINGMYNIILYTSMVPAFAFGGWLSKRKDRLYTYRIGLVITASFYLAVIFAQEHVVAWYVAFALFSGIATGLYWSGYLVLQYDVSDERNRIHYLAMNMIAFTAAGLVGPALAGKVITGSDGLQGYILVFGLAFVMFLLAAAGSLRIKPRPSRHKAYYLRYAPAIMKREPDWFKGLIAYFLLGLFNGIMLFLPNILLFRVMPREDYIGYMGMLFAALTICTGILISRYAKEKFGRIYLFVSSLGLIISAAVLLIRVNLATVVGFMVLYSLFSPLQGNTLGTIYYRMIGRLPLKGQFRVESVVMREVFLSAGRAISILALISFSGGIGGAVLPWMMFGGAVIQILLPLLVHKRNESSNGG